MTRKYCVSAVIACVVISCGEAFAQTVPPGRGGQVREDTPMFLLMDEQVRRELELLPEQLEELGEIRRKGQEGARELISAMRDLDDAGRRAKWGEIQAKMRERRDALQEEVHQILLPHQQERLKEIYVQVRMRSGAGQALEDDFLTERLGLTEAQKEQLAKVRADVETELQEKMREIRAEAEQKILSVLTPSQREQLKNLRGEPFDFEQPESDGDS